MIFKTAEEWALCHRKNLTTVVSVPLHAVPAYIVSRDIALNQFSNQHGVYSLTILHLATAKTSKHLSD